MKDPTKAVASIFFKLSAYTFLMPIYWITIHLMLTPLRIVTALYYDVILYISVMLGDLVAEVFRPKIEGMRKHRNKKAYFIRYMFGFPKRLVTFFIKSFLTLVDSLFMFSMAVVLPTTTMYHGTDFNHAISNIAQKGRWKVGDREYAGRGIYLALEKRTAKHYARDKQNEGIIVARTTLSFVRNVASLEKGIRGKVGYDGGSMSQEISPFWSTVEHWRGNTWNWWEYCIIHRGGMNEFVKTWRIRPIVFLDENDNLKRLWGGQANYSTNTLKSFLIGIICTFLMIPFVAFTIGFLVS